MKYFKNNQSQLVFNLGLILAFSLAWALPRYQLFTENTMMHDDYVLSNSVDSVVGQSLITHRPTSMYFILGALYFIPNLFSNNISMILSALSIGVVSFFLFKLLNLILTEKEKYITFLTILIFIFHPVINDFSAWNTVVHQVWALLTAVLAFYFIWNRGALYFVVGTILMFLTVSSYQLMMSIPLVIGLLLFLHLGSINKNWNYSQIVRLIASQAIASILYFIYMKYVSIYLLRVYSIPQEIVTQVDLSFPDLKESFFRTLDIYLNLYLPLFSYYLGANTGLSLWKYIPLFLLSIGGFSILVLIFKNRIKIIPAVLLGLTWLILPFVSMMPFWIISIYTEWRVSVIMFVTQIFVLASILATFSVAIQSFYNNSIYKLYRLSLIVVFISIYAIILPVNSFDIKMRVEDYQYDLSIADNIKQYWEKKNISISEYRVFYRKPDLKTVVEKGNLLTKANVFINTYSTLSYGKIWGDAFMKFHGFQTVEFEAIKGIDFSKSNQELSNFNRIERLIPLPYVIHYSDEKISLIYGMPQVVSRY